MRHFRSHALAMKVSRIRSVLRHLTLLAATGIISLMVIPSGVWRSPVNDAQYHGFDPQLIYANPRGNGSADAAISISAGRVDVSTVPYAQPVITLITTSLPAIDISTDVLADGTEKTIPLKLGLWSPWNGNGYFVVFGPPPSRAVSVEWVTNADANVFPTGGITEERLLGSYVQGGTYNLRIITDSAHDSALYTVSGPGINVTSPLAKSAAHDLFRDASVSLTATSISGGGVSQASLLDFWLTLPHQRYWANKVDDIHASIIVVVLLLISALLMAERFVSALLGGVGLAGNWSDWTDRAGSWVKRLKNKRLATLILVSTALYLVGNALLFSLGSHPYDMANERVYSRVATQYGMANLYYLPNVVPLANVWGGVPYGAAPFPYEPVMAYLFGFVGFIGSLGSSSVVSAAHMEYVIKMIDVIFGLLDAGLIFLIVKRFNASVGWALVGAGAFLFNPAVWFSMSIWGQTHVFSLFLFLAAVWLAETNRPTLSWIALGAAVLTRPQMLVFGLLFGAVLIRKFHLQENVRAISLAVVATFLMFAPFAMKTSVSLPLDVMANNVHIQAGVGNASELRTVSQDAYSLWPLVTYIVDGSRGLERIFSPSARPLVEGISYQSAGQLLTAAALLAVATLLIFRRQTDRGEYMPVLAVGMVAFLMLTPGLVATHFVLALPLLLMSRRWLGNLPYLYIVAIWSTTSLIAMWGDMGNVSSFLDHGNLPLDPKNSAVTNFVTGLYGSDRFITTAVVANIAAAIWLTALSLRTRVRVAPPHAVPS